MAYFRTGGGGQAIDLLNPDVVDYRDKATTNPDTTIAVTQRPRFIRYTYVRNSSSTAYPGGSFSYDIDNLKYRRLTYGSNGYVDTNGSFEIGASGYNVKSVSDSQVVITNNTNYPVHQIVEIWY